MESVEETDPLEGTPGPSPWYLRGAPDPVPGFSWEDPGSGPGRAGRIVLSGPDGPVFILDFYNYVQPLDESRLLVWYQVQTPVGEPTAPIRMLVLEPAKMPVLEGKRKALFEEMDTSEAQILFRGAPEAEFLLPTNIAAEDLGAEFPAALASLAELLLMCHCSAVDGGPAGEGGDLALLIAQPARSTYRLYPQDWFNQGEYDYGYEWVTRVRRDPASGKVQGDGIRLLPFTLDDTLRNLAPDPAPGA